MIFHSFSSMPACCCRRRYGTWILDDRATAPRPEDQDMANNTDSHDGQHPTAQRPEEQRYNDAVGGLSVCTSITVSVLFPPSQVLTADFFFLPQGTCMGGNFCEGASIITKLSRCSEAGRSSKVGAWRRHLPLQPATSRRQRNQLTQKPSQMLRKKCTSTLPPCLKKKQSQLPPQMNANGPSRSLFRCVLASVGTTVRQTESPTLSMDIRKSQHRAQGHRRPKRKG